MFDKNKILIAGAGSIGSVIGVLLADKGFNVTLLRRNPPFGNIDIQLFGIIDLSEQVEVKNIKDIEAVYDLIFITTQTQHTRKLLESLKSKNIIGSKTIIVSLQNGLETSKIICELCPENPIIQATVWWSATLYKPTKILYHRADKTIIGIPKCSRASNPVLEELKSILGGVLEIELSNSIEEEQHKKLILNVVSPVLALVKQPYPEGLQNDLVRELVHRMFDEALNIADKLGWNVEDEKLLNFHKILKGIKPVPKGIERGNYPHKVSTQIGLEKYGGKSSNVHILLDKFESEGSIIANRLISIVYSLDANYTAFNDNQIQDLLDVLPVPNCSLSS